MLLRSLCVIAAALFVSCTPKSSSQVSQPQAPPSSAKMELTPTIGTKILEEPQKNFRIAADTSTVDRFLKQGAREILLEIQKQKFTADQVELFNRFEKTDSGQLLGLYALSYSVDLPGSQRGILYLGVYESLISHGKSSLVELEKANKVIAAWNSQKATVDPATEPISFLHRHLISSGGFK